MALVTLLFSVSLITNTTAQARPKHLTVKYAINLNWCGKPKKSCAAGREALRVAWCESHWYTWAKNGQYLGIFQMGSNERKLFGHGNNAWDQAKAAYKYYVVSGRDWSPWSCRWAA